MVHATSGDNSSEYYKRIGIEQRTQPTGRLKGGTVRGREQAFLLQNLSSYLTENRTISDLLLSAYLQPLCGGESRFRRHRFERSCALPYPKALKLKDLTGLLDSWPSCCTIDR